MTDESQRMLARIVLECMDNKLELCIDPKSNVITIMPVGNMQPISTQQVTIEGLEKTFESVNDYIRKGDHEWNILI